MAEADTIIRVEHAYVRYNLSKPNLGIRDYVQAIAKHQLLFQEFMALQDISLEIKKGESWGIVGKNGSGKSTLLKLITGIIRPYKGSVAVSGTVAPLLELGAGFDPELTGRENIIMNGLILGMSKSEVNAKFDEIVDFAEIREFLDVPLKNYSSGMKSRLGFSVATSSKADILIADEVLSTGDKAFQQKCEKRMEELLSGGTTLLYVSHSIGTVRRMCGKALWLDGGKEQMQGAAESVLDQYDAFMSQKK